MKKIKVLFLAFVILLSACSNIFQSASKQEFDEAYYVNAQVAIDAQKWDKAIAEFEKMSANYKARTEVREAWAGAYAGKCGFNFATFLGNINSISGATPILKVLMNMFTNVTVDPYYCYLAQTKMEEITTLAAERTTSQALFLVFIGLARIGAYLKAQADQDADTNMDGTFNACTPVGSFGMTTAARSASGKDDEFSDEEVKMLITGFGLVFENLTTTVENIIGASNGSAIDAIQTACNLALGAGACNITDPTNSNPLTPAVVTTFRALIHTGAGNPVAFGAGSCVNPFFEPGCCPP
ncbi:MAG: hypothetical protein LW875_09520 [Proteobacteria bacterium]|jgi:hypothetical protein|nr:hypothetical protein [Pseudomonadota bacterium]